MGSRSVKYIFDEVIMNTSSNPAAVEMISASPGHIYARGTAA